MQHVQEYLDAVEGKMIRSGDIALWMLDPRVYEDQWSDLVRENACVYDFFATSSLVRVLLQSKELKFRDNSTKTPPFEKLRVKYLPTDSRVLHQLIFHDKIYLNITNDIKSFIAWEVLESYGIAAEYPRPRSKEYLGVYQTLKPLLMPYLYTLVKSSHLVDWDSIWRNGINQRNVGSIDVFLSYLFDEYAKYKSGERSYFYNLLGLLNNEKRGQVYY